MPKTRLEKIQTQLKNSWIGVLIIVGSVVLVSVVQFGDAVAKISSWMRPAPAADISVQAASVEPLAADAPVHGTGPDTVYPLGARVKFLIRHDQRGQGTINLSAVNLNVLSFERTSDCPYSVDGDKIYGAGPTPVKVFKVQMSDGGVEAVQVKLGPDGTVWRGRSSNLLDLDPPINWSLTDTGPEATEPMEIRISLSDPGTYKLDVSLQYMTLEEVRTKPVISFKICRPEA